MSTASMIGGSLFWQTFLAFRLCWLRGRFGAGKTALAVVMLARLLAEGHVEQVVGNIPLSFSTVAKSPLKNAGILLDESWIYLESRRDVVDYAGFVRKFNHYLLLPSVFPIHNRLSFFFVQRLFNGYTVGLPFWAFEWGIRDKVVKEKGVFLLWRPSAVFGHYPTNYVAGDDGGISDVVSQTARYAGFIGTRSKQKAEAVVSFTEGGMPGGAEDIEETLDDFSGSLDLSISDVESAVKQIKASLRK